MLLKVLIILILIVYTFYRVSSFFFKVVLGGTSRDNPNTRQNRSNSNGKINIDRTPREKGVKRDQGYSGGEYVDFEEVK